MAIEKHERSAKGLAKVTVSGQLGTILEFMDLQLYSLGAALVLHEIFLPKSSATMVLILTTGTYGVGYVARIVGASVFDKMGDRIGHKKVLLITIVMMRIYATSTGVLPTHTQTGVSAPILLVTLCVIQGLGAGAEISSADTMLAEYVPKGKHGIIFSFAVIRTNYGILSATAIWAFIFFTLSKEELPTWGWCISFLTSVVVMVLAIRLHMNLKESPVFGKVNDSNQPTVKLAPTGSMFQSKSFWLVTGLRFGQAGNSGLTQISLTGYLAQTLLFGKAVPTDALVISSILGFMATPFLGWLSGRTGRRTPCIIMDASAIVLAWSVLSIIVDKSCTPNTVMVALIMVHNCIVLGLFVLKNITTAEMFGYKSRSTRMAVSKEIGGPIVPDLGPILAGIFCTMTESWYPVTIIVTVYSVAGLISALKVPEVKDRDLGVLKDAAENQPYVMRAAQSSRSL